MTDKQFKICGAVIRYRTLPEILAATGLRDHDALRDEAGVENLYFSDWNMDANTIVTLTDKAMEQYEKRKRDDADRNFTRRVAIYGAVMSTIAIASEIELHFL